MNKILSEDCINNCAVVDISMTQTTIHCFFCDWHKNEWHLKSEEQYVQLSEYFFPKVKI